MDLKLSFVVLASLIGVAACQVFSWGACPTVGVQDNFDTEQYMGQWYEMERFFAIFESFQDCVSASYTLQDTGVVIVNNTGYSYLWRKYYSILGDAIAEDPSTPAKLSVRFFPNQPRGDYWVLATDYENYSVVWSCKETSLGFIGKFNTQFAWILTRSPEGISDDTRTILYNMLEDNGIRTRKFSHTNQSGCPGR